MKKQSSECTHIIPLLKIIIGKHFKVFHKFADAADQYIKLLSWYKFSDGDKEYDEKQDTDNIF